jgi:hypothetical protein
MEGFGIGERTAKQAISTTTAKGLIRQNEWNKTYSKGGNNDSEW